MNKKTFLIIFTALFMLMLSLSGCLLFYSAPEIDVPDQTISLGDTLTLDLRDYTQNKEWHNLSFHLKADSLGKVDENTYTFTGTTVGAYTETVTASNGLRTDETTFTITVTQN